MYPAAGEVRLKRPPADVFAVESAGPVDLFDGGIGLFAGGGDGVAAGSDIQYAPTV